VGSPNDVETKQRRAVFYRSPEQAYPVAVRAEGMYISDAVGNSYLDMSDGGANAARRNQGTFTLSIGRAPRSATTATIGTLGYRNRVKIPTQRIEQTQHPAGRRNAHQKL